MYDRGGAHDGHVHDTEPARPVVGVHLRGGDAYLAVVDPPELLRDEQPLRRLQRSPYMDPADALADVYGRARQLLRGLAPAEVALLHTRAYRNWAYSEAFQRASMESALMLAARTEGVGYVLVKQEEAAATLGCAAPQLGARALTLRAGPAPLYWRDRSLAYAAAIHLRRSAASGAGEAEGAVAGGAG